VPLARPQAAGVGLRSPTGVQRAAWGSGPLRLRLGTLPASRALALLVECCEDTLRRRVIPSFLADVAEVDQVARADDEDATLLPGIALRGALALALTQGTNAAYEYTGPD